MSSESYDPLDGSSDQSASQMIHSALSFLRIVWLRKAVIAAAMGVAALLGILYFVTAPRFYESDASLLILQTGGDVLTPSMSVEGSKQEIIPTYQQLIKSAVVLQGAINNLPAEHRIDFRGIPRDRWVEALAKNLSADAVRRTNIINITYQSRHAVTAAAVVDAVLKAYFEFIDRTHKGTAGQIIDVLSREKVQLEKQLDHTEAQLLEARGRFGDLGIKPGGQIVHPLIQRAIRLNEALVETWEKRLELESSQFAIQSAVRNGEDLQQHILTVEAAVGREMLMAALGFNSRDAGVQANLERDLLEDRSELKSVTEYLGPAHPRVAEISDRIRMTEQYQLAYQNRVNQRLAELKNNQLAPMLTQMLGQALAKAMQKENATRESFEKARADAVRLNGDLAQLEILEHDVRRLRGFHDVLINQIANTDLRQEHGDIRATVVKEPAPSHSPVSPRITVVAALCTVSALLIGGICIYVMDILDDRFRSPEELRIHLGVPVLAMVRELETSEQPGLGGVQTHLSPDSVESEAFRTLRTALALSPNETDRIVISSSEPGDGKTTVVVNLAVSYAQAGKKTLLIDADLRRPGLTSMLGLKGECGLSDILRSTGEVAQRSSEAIRHSEIEGLDILTSGPRRPNPSELLAGGQFADLLAWAESVYDQVLVDSPPVLAASDAQMIGRLVDGVILVVHAEKSHRRVVVRATDCFTAVGVNVLGVVANRINAEVGKGYGYGYGYVYAYGQAEGDAAEPTDVEVASVTFDDHAQEQSPEPQAPPSPQVPRRVA